MEQIELDKLKSYRKLSGPDNAFDYLFDYLNKVAELNPLLEDYLPILPDHLKSGSNLHEVLFNLGKKAIQTVEKSIRRYQNHEDNYQRKSYGVVDYDNVKSTINSTFPFIEKRITTSNETKDMRQLLKKYIQHVGREEGTVFLCFPNDFTPEEWTTLHNCLKK